MGQEGGEKTEEPTDKKIRDAREKGQVSKSKDVGMVLTLLGLTLYFYFGWDWMQNIAISSILSPKDMIHFADFEQALHALMLEQFNVFMMLSFPPLIVVIVFAIAGNVAQFGFLFTFETLKPNLKSLNPIEGVKKIFNKKSLMQLILSVVKMAILGGLLWYLIDRMFQSLVNLLVNTPETVEFFVNYAISEMLIYTLVSFIILAALDFFFQKAQHIKSLKMSKDEVKREHKDMEGDPQIKGKRKELAKEYAMNETVENTRQASVVVTNPDHIAVAMYYNDELGQLPFVVAKGKNELALAMIRVAQIENIPIMRNIPLARNLFENTELMRFLPNDLIKPMAEVIRWLIKNVKNKKTE